MQNPQSTAPDSVTNAGPSPQLDNSITTTVTPAASLVPITLVTGGLDAKKMQLAEAHTRVYDAFSRAFSRQNSQFEKAIRSLDSLNDQIVEFVLSTGKENEDNPKQRLVLEPSLALMKKLLLDAQGKFRKMVEENQQLASRIDGELQCAHKEVDMLRQDLAETNKRISEMQQATNSSKNKQNWSNADNINNKSNESDQDFSGVISAEKRETLIYGQEFNHSKDSPFQVTQLLINGTDDSDDDRPKNFFQEQILLLREENERLADKNVALLREVDELRYLKDAILKTKDKPEEGGGEEEFASIRINPKVSKLTLELTHAKEALSALKADRKRLKAEKFDLLNQMKQLYATLEDKERELRDFIRNYEQRMKESDESLRQLTIERDANEREKWNLLKHAREEAERGVNLAAQLGMKDSAVKRLQEELEMARRQLVTFGYSSEGESMRMNGGGQNYSALTPTCSPLPVSTPTPSGSTPTCSPLPLSNCTSTTTNGRGSSADSGVRLSSDRDSTASHEGGPGTPNKEVGSATIYANPSLIRDDSRSSLGRGERFESHEGSSEGKDTSSCTTPVNGNTTFSHGMANNNNGNNTAANPTNGSSNTPLSRSAEQLCERISETTDPTPKSRGSTMTLTRKCHKVGGTWGSISRVFARQKKKAAADAALLDGNPVDKRASWSPGSSLCVSPLSEESYVEKLRLLEEAQHVPLERWKAQTVLAWLEVTLGMPQYGAMCAENVRSGKVLLELSDSELDAGLGIENVMHRKKLRLAIEELRDPRRRKFPKISLLTHTWVSAEWLPDLGLPQYSEIFANNLVDGRLLENMTKKDLEKHLGVSRKFHQASIINGVNLLRIFRFDRQLLAEKRRQCEQTDCDPVVWTNYRWIRWARCIDLVEYADNLKESGVHGALVVLENTFSADTMATALGIPSSKNIIRRHLGTEFENLILPARRQMEEQARYAKIERRRQEKMSAGGSLGRSFVRNYATIERTDKDKRRTSLRGSLSRAFGLKVRDDMVSQQNGGNGLESSECIYSSPRGPPPTHIPIRNQFSNHQQGGPYNSRVSYGTSQESVRPSGIYGPSPPHPVYMVHGRPRSSVVPSSVAAFNHRENHRRVRSISDIEHITITPV